ncbi:MAG TPA: PAS domain-containing protein [Chthoniobacteraceae bacterium]|jgi:PAS domain S-box-containing protein
MKAISSQSEPVLAGVDLPLEVFDAMPALVRIFEPSGELVYRNPAAVRMMGDSLGEGLDAWIDGVASEDRPLVVRTFRNALVRRTPQTVQFRMQAAAGHIQALSDHLNPITSADGEFLGLLCMANAVELQQAAPGRSTSMERRTGALLHGMLEGTADLVALLTLGGQVLFLNETGRKYAGLTREDALEGQHLSGLHPGWAFEIVEKEGIPTAIREGQWHGETAIIDRAGRETPVSQTISGHAGPDGQIEFLSTIIRDISDRKREEITRMEWANRYDAAIRASGQLLFDWNSFTNDVTYAGDVEHFLGYTMSEMSGGLDRFRQLILPADVPPFDREIQRVTATRDPFRLDFQVQCKDGSILDIASKGYFFLDREGQIGRMVGFLADATAQKAAQDALARAHENLELRVEQRTAELARAYTVIRDRAHQQEAVAQLGQEALANADLPVLLQDASELVRRILEVEFCSILRRSEETGSLVACADSGWPKEQVADWIGTGGDSLSGYTLSVREPVIVEDMSEEKRFAVSPAIRSCGVVSSVSVIIEAAEAPLGVLAAFSARRRKFEQDDVHFLQSVANVLTAAIERRRAEENIRQAREQAESANRAKSEFLSRMSHELRTPLNAILGFTQLLELDNPTATQHESVEHISQAGRHLLSLINEVLDIARIESGRLALTSESLDVHDLIQGVVELIRPLTGSHQIQTIVAPNHSGRLFVIADQQRLKQVMLNLFSNAVKYNRPHGSVTVSCAPFNHTKVKISVTDTGRGISRERMKRLFLPFERLGAESTNIEGTGIGLALSRGIVTALDGELGAESTEGMGSTFWVVLPRSNEPVAPVFLPVPAAPVAPVMPVLQIASPRQQVLLYIEDQDLNLRLVERILQSRSEYRLLTAMLGGLGLELAREHRPDLILLDLNLPDMSGDEVLKELKRDPDLRDIPVIMVSADAMGDRIKDIMALGAAGYLTKPYKVAEFLRVIEVTLPA